MGGGRSWPSPPINSPAFYLGDGHCHSNLPWQSDPEILLDECRLDLRKVCPKCAPPPITLDPLKAGGSVLTSRRGRFDS